MARPALVLCGALPCWLRQQQQQCECRAAAVDCRCRFCLEHEASSVPKPGVKHCLPLPITTTSRASTTPAGGPRVAQQAAHPRQQGMPRQIPNGSATNGVRAGQLQAPRPTRQAGRQAGEGRQSLTGGRAAGHRPEGGGWGRPVYSVSRSCRATHVCGLQHTYSTLVGWIIPVGCHTLIGYWAVTP